MQKREDLYKIENFIAEFFEGLHRCFKEGSGFVLPVHVGADDHTRHVRLAFDVGVDIPYDVSTAGVLQIIFIIGIII